MRTVRVNLEERSYDIYIGSGLLAKLGDYLREVVQAKKAFVISDENVFKHYGKTAVETLKKSGYEVSYEVVPPGEKSKSLEAASRIYDRLYDTKIDRSDVLIGLGGGMIGDLTGFVSGTWLRGVPFVQVPTTLEADIDASVGGKTAVNHPNGKNLIGVFNQPRMVLMDTDALKTLSDRDIRAGLAESIKHAVIRNAEFFEFHRKNVKKILSLDESLLEDLLARNCGIKAEVVSADEREESLRAILNFGHTIGHAIESSGQFELRHGEAVALGMVGAGFIAAAKGIFSQEEFQAMENLISDFELPCRCSGLDFDVLDELMKRDKKVKAGKLRFVLPTSIGKIEITDEVDIALIAKAVEYLSKKM